MRALHAVRRGPPGGWLRFAAQMALLFAVNAVYEVARALLEGPAPVALDHARDIIAVEEALGIFVERDLQELAYDAPAAVMELAIWVYQNCQRLITWSFVVWLYVARNDWFPRVRDTIIVADLLGLAGYWLYPTAPPRLTPGYGFVDSLDPLQENLRSSLVGSLTNLYAAVPSLHTAYAILIGVTGARACRHLPARIAWAAYPLAVVLATVVTANHWLLDAVAGAAAFAVAYAVSGRLERRRRAGGRPAPGRVPSARSAPPPPA